VSKLTLAEQSEARRSIVGFQKISNDHNSKSSKTKDETFIFLFIALRDVTDACHVLD